MVPFDSQAGPGDQPPAPALLDAPVTGDRFLEGLAEVAAALCSAPAAMVTAVDHVHHRVLARTGLHIPESGRELSFCAHTLLEPDAVTEVGDARVDPRFAGNPLVTGPPFVRFYAGVPFPGPDGSPQGTLCAFDTVPRTLEPAARLGLRRLAGLAAEHLRARYGQSSLERLLDVLPALAGLHGREDLGLAARTVAEAMAELLRSDVAAVLTPDGPDLRCAGAATSERPLPRRPETLLIDPRLDRAVTVALASGTPLFIPDAVSSDLMDAALVAEFGIASALYLPLPGPDGPLGVAQAWWSAPVAGLSEEMQRLAVALVAEAGSTVGRLRAEAELREPAGTDPLTGLANRRSFLADLDRLPRASALAVVELRGLGSATEEEVDRLLRAFAAHLRSVVRGGDVACRWADDSFAVALPHAGEDGALRMLARLKEAWPSGSVGFLSGFAATDGQEHPVRALERAELVLQSRKS